MFNEQAYAERQHQIAIVMKKVDEKRADLSGRILRGDVDLADARQRAAIHGVLGNLWREFIELSPDEQVAALGEPTFKTMAWQSLLQASPFPRLATTADPA
jgi:hypothetical protein